MHPEYFIRKLFKRTAVVSIGLFLCSYASAENYLYKTFEDFQLNRYQRFDSVDYSKNAFHFFMKDGSASVYNPREIWGFEYQYELFRVYKEELFLVNLEGKIIEYTTGQPSFAALNGQKYRAPARESATPTDYPKVFVSNDFNSDIYTTYFTPMSTGLLRRFSGEYKSFMEKYPQHQQLFNCTEGSYSEGLFFKCLKAYNGNDSSPVKFQQDSWDFGKHYVEFSNLKNEKEFKGTAWLINESKDTVQIEATRNTRNLRCEYSQGTIPPAGKVEIVVYLDIPSIVSGLYGKGYNDRSEMKHRREIAVKLKGVRKKVFATVTVALDVDGTK